VEPSIQRIIQEEDKAYTLLATSKLGEIISARSGLCQRRRSARVQSQHGPELEHRRLLEKLMDCGQ
jgi:hypothetical protein